MLNIDFRDSRKHPFTFPKPNPTKHLPVGLKLPVDCTGKLTLKRPISGHAGLMMLSELESRDVPFLTVGGNGCRLYFFADGASIKAKCHILDELVVCTSPLSETIEWSLLADSFHLKGSAPRRIRTQHAFFTSVEIGGPCVVTQLKIM